METIASMSDIRVIFEANRNEQTNEQKSPKANQTRHKKLTGCVGFCVGGDVGKGDGGAVGKEVGGAVLGCGVGGSVGNGVGGIVGGSVLG